MKHLDTPLKKLIMPKNTYGSAASRPSHPHSPPHHRTPTHQGYTRHHSNTGNDFHHMLLELWEYTQITLLFTNTTTHFIVYLYFTSVFFMSWLHTLAPLNMRKILHLHSTKFYST